MTTRGHYTAGSSLDIPPVFAERALYVAEGSIEIAADRGRYERGRLLVLKPEATVEVRAVSAARLMLLGGPPLDGPRHIWWNFVSSSRERIERAREDWRQGRFARVPGETELIPLPGPLQTKTVRYP